MPGEAMTSKAVLDADTRPFIEGYGKAQGSVKGLQDQLTKFGSLAAAITSGFGIAAALGKARQMWDSLVQNMEADARRTSRGQGGGAQAQDFRAQAAQARADRLNIFSPVGTGAKAAGIAELAGLARLTGQSELADELAARAQELIQALKDQANASDSLEQGLLTTARQLEERNRRALSEAGGAADALSSRGFGDLATVLRKAITGGDVDAITDVLAQTRREQAARLREETRYWDLGR